MHVIHMLDQGFENYCTSYYRKSFILRIWGQLWKYINRVTLEQNMKMTICD